MSKRIGSLVVWEQGEPPYDGCYLTVWEGAVGFNIYHKGEWAMNTVEWWCELPAPPIDVAAAARSLKKVLEALENGR